VGKFAEFPLTIVDGVPTVPVSINGKESRFHVNSGFFFSQIQASQVSRFGLRARDIPGDLTATRLGGKESQLNLVTVKDFRIAGFRLPYADFVVSYGLGSRIGHPGESAEEVEIPGTVGQNILSVADVEYDLPGGALRLMRARDCSNTNLAYWSGDKPVSIMEIEGLDQLQRHVAGALYLNGKRFRAIFNSGMRQSIVSLDAAASLGLTPGSSSMELKKPEEAGERPRWIGSFDSVKLGDEEIRRTHLIVGKLALPDLDAIIAADFFRAHRVYVATSSHRLFFTYTGGKPFDY
jgi:hypothetical protein